MKWWSDVPSRLDSSFSRHTYRVLSTIALNAACCQPLRQMPRTQKWLDELLEVIRVHVRRACARVPLQHGLTAGLGWFKEVGSISLFGYFVRIPSSLY